jgi:phosphoribosyl 1,2-cyclic phosphodiesterase
MKLKFLGVRGSRPTHKRGLLGFGGNSTSLEFTLDGEEFFVFLDGGSGLANRGRNLGEKPGNRRFHFLITHTHWDHILGFPFFDPIYNGDNDFTLYASNTTKSTFNDLFFGLQRVDNLPVPLSKFKAKMQFKMIHAGEEFSIENKIRVNTYQINHQGVTLGYRLEYGDDSVAVITDNAPIENGNYMGENMKMKAQSDPAAFEAAYDEGLIKFLKNCNTVVFDTHFTEKNIKPDWGHSTPQRALEFCRKANVSRLILFHHAPEDLDDDVMAKVQSVLDAAMEYGVEVVAAKEGDEWELR